VPKNDINDSIVMRYIIAIDTGSLEYALQVTTDAPHWGGLGGSTLSEASSWGKVSKKATHELAFVETSVALPMIYAYALQKNATRGRKRPPLHLERRHPGEDQEGVKNWASGPAQQTRNPSFEPRGAPRVVGPCRDNLPHAGGTSESPAASIIAASKTLAGRGRGRKS